MRQQSSRVDSHNAPFGILYRLRPTQIAAAPQFMPVATLPFCLSFPFFFVDNIQPQVNDD
jgi:hypothetical protein